MNEEKHNHEPAPANETTPAHEPTRVERPTRAAGKYILISAIVAVAAFLLGFIPMWMRANEAENDRESAQAALRLLQLENSLASAVIDARRGDYEPARQATSGFFTSLREEADRGKQSALTPEQRQAVSPVFDQRDQLITLLARSDPASSDRLSDLYVSFRDMTDGSPPVKGSGISTNSRETAVGAPPK